MAAWNALRGNVKQRFTNLGYNGAALELKAEDENERLHFQLYNTICTGVDFKGKNVLELSCGRGGGCYFIKKYLGASNVTGTDLSHYNIEIAKKQSSLEGITFMQQSVEEMNFAAASFDIVVNLEASNGYSDRKQFAADVYKVLKPGGYFVYADIFKTSALPMVKDYLLGLGFALQRETDLTPGVLSSIELRSKQHNSAFKKGINRLVKTFYYTPESKGFKMLQQGEQRYYSFVFKKI